MDKNSHVYFNASFMRLLLKNPQHALGWPPLRLYGLPSHLRVLPCTTFVKAVSIYVFCNFIFRLIVIFYVF